MKALLMVLMLSAIVLGQVLTNDLGVSYLFDKTTEVTAILDSVKTIADSSYIDVFGNRQLYYYYQTPSTADTIYSREVSNKAYGDHWVTIRVLRNSGNINTTVYIGVWNGAGYPDRTGWIWNKVAHFDTTGTSIVSFADSTWWTERPTSKYQYKISEESAQGAKYVIWDHQFKQER